MGMDVNQFMLEGTITRIQVNGKGERTSCVLLIQYGPETERSGRDVDFVNAALVRLNPFRYEKVKDRLAEGARVEIKGHTQGVLKRMMDSVSMTTELVADRVIVNTPRPPRAERLVASNDDGPAPVIAAAA